MKIENEDDAFKCIDYLHNEFGIPNVVITSLELDSHPDKIFVIGSRKGEERFKITIDKIDGNFTGTGDMFSALILARHHEPLSTACHKTVSSIHKILQDTQEKPNQELALIENRAVISNPEIIGELNHYSI